MQVEAIYCSLICCDFSWWYYAVTVKELTSILQSIHLGSWWPLIALCCLLLMLVSTPLRIVWRYINVRNF